MTENEALAWLEATGNVSRETLARLDAFRQMVIAENERQNLISAGTVPAFWARHIVDSAQLLVHAPVAANPRTDRAITWLDLGSGAGFPAIVIALLTNTPIVCVESRRKRAEFLTDAVSHLGLTHVTVVHQRLELMPMRKFSVITARAFAPLPKLFETAQRFSNSETVWILPKGQSAREELETTRETWHGSFHVKQSVSDPAASIIIASQVQRLRQPN